MQVSALGLVGEGQMALEQSTREEVVSLDYLGRGWIPRVFGPAASCSPGLLRSVSSFDPGTCYGLPEKFDPRIPRLSPSCYVCVCSGYDLHSEVVVLDRLDIGS